jgi:hypothetical protein
MMRAVGTKSVVGSGHLVAMLLVAASTLFGSPLRTLAQSETESAPEVTDARRVMVTSTVSLSAAVLAMGTGLGAGVGVARRCENESLVSGFGCGIAGALVIEGFTFVVLPTALTLGTYFAHRGLDGRGRWYAALAGSGAGVAAGVGVLAASAKDSDRALVAGAIMGGLVATAMPVLALELSHLRRSGQERRVSRAQRVRVMPVASALPNGGGWLGLVGTL